MEASGGILWQVVEDHLLVVSNWRHHREDQHKITGWLQAIADADGTTSKDTINRTLSNAKVQTPTKTKGKGRKALLPYALTRKNATTGILGALFYCYQSTPV